MAQEEGCFFDDRQVLIFYGNFRIQPDHLWFTKGSPVVCTESSLFIIHVLFAGAFIIGWKIWKYKTKRSSASPEDPYRTTNDNNEEASNA